jgi:glycosyltransferase involved in cell wall biosynthesis
MTIPTTPSPLSVSVIIPTYNYGAYIGEAIQSVLADDWDSLPMELLVVDDGSDDDTRAVVRSFGPPVRYVYTLNRGQAHALSTGWAMTNGETVCLLDADDLWVPGKARRITEALRSAPTAGLLYHRLLYQGRQAEAAPRGEAPALSGDLPASPRALLAYRGRGTSALVLRRTVMDSLFPLPEALRPSGGKLSRPDGYLVYLAPFLGPVVGIEDRLAIYRIHTQSRVKDPKDRSRAELSLARALRTWLRSNGEDVTSFPLYQYLRIHELEAAQLALPAESHPHLRGLLLQLQQILLSRHWCSRRYQLFQLATLLMHATIGPNLSAKTRRVYLDLPWLLSAREIISPYLSHYRSPGMPEAS